MAGCVSREEVEAFFKGRDPMERIVKIECGYDDKCATLIYRDANGDKKAATDAFRPFCWVSDAAERKMFGGSADALEYELKKRGITRTALRTHKDGGPVIDRMESGYKYLYQADAAMSYNDFISFFDYAGAPLFGEESLYTTITPVEQYMIHSGRRLFKGYDDYDDIVRMEWYMETDGYNPNIHTIQRISVHTNKGYQAIFDAGDIGELEVVRSFLSAIKTILPDVITGHGNEGRQIPFIDARLVRHGTSLSKLSGEYFRHRIYKSKRKSVLKLGSEMEYYNKTVIWGINITDSLHAIRRAQAQDPSMKHSDIKYVAAYSKIQGARTPHYSMRNNGRLWNSRMRFSMDTKTGRYGKPGVFSPSDKTFSGREVAENHIHGMLSDIDKVELMYNQSNFLVGKMIPVSFERACTMGTAAIWKAVMLAWSYENGLAIPVAEKQRSVSGGLSRLFNVGFVMKMTKYDYNSMYPAIALTYDIRISTDIMDVMPSMLEYILGEREMYKGLMKVYRENASNIRAEKRKYALAVWNLQEYKGMNRKEFGKAVVRIPKFMDMDNRQRDNEALARKYEKIQMPFKVVGNAWFGSILSQVLPWNDLDKGEEITCIGRQMFRLLIAHFERKKGYKTIVGDSVSGDTPLLVRYDKGGRIEKKAIAEIFDETRCHIDGLGRQYDVSAKPYSVLCRSGWIKPNYVYRHKAGKALCRVSDGVSTVDCTDDHSLFDSNGLKITPKGIDRSTRLLYFKGSENDAKLSKYLKNNNI